MSSSLLIALEESLSGLYDTVEDSRRLLSHAGIATGLVAFSPRARVNWHFIVTEAAKQGRLHELVNAALRDYPGHHDLNALAQALSGQASSAGGNRRPTDSAHAASPTTDPVGARYSESPAPSAHAPARGISTPRNYLVVPLLFATIAVVFAGVRSLGASVAASLLIVIVMTVLVAALLTIVGSFTLAETGRLSQGNLLRMLRLGFQAVLSIVRRQWWEP